MGSVGSFGSVLSVGSALSIGSALSRLSAWSALSERSYAAVLGSRQRGLRTAAVRVLAGALALTVRGRRCQSPGPSTR